MALLPDNVETRESREDIENRFLIAQNGPKPTEAQLSRQSNLAAEIINLAADFNQDVEDSREKSLALTHLEEALMWAGKAIFK